METAVETTSEKETIKTRNDVIALGISCTLREPLKVVKRIVKATMCNVEAAKAPYKALALPGMEGPNDVTKAFMTSDKKAAVFCSKSTVPSAAPHSCTNWIAVN